jgi:ATP phosphoribosyltransferase regulatory subunit HisZ
MLGTLSDAEIIELTNRRHRPKQIEALRSMGVRFLVRADGTIAVARAHVELLLGVSSKPVREPQLRP